MPHSQTLFCPVVDFVRDNDSYKAHKDGRILTKALMEWFWKHYLGDATSESLGDDVQYVAPLQADLKGLPPTALFTAGFDPLRSEGEELNDRLRKQGVQVAYREFPSLTHNFQTYTAVPAARRASTMH